MVNKTGGNPADQLDVLLSDEDLVSVKKKVRSIKKSVKLMAEPPDYSCVLTDLNQILEAYTLERAHYYIKRLIKSLNEPKILPYSDINLNQWKQYDEILTDSLWVLPDRAREGVHQGGYWGNFAPQIPHQLMMRYTKKGDWVLDPFLGSGTTLIECRRLGRNGIGIELQNHVFEQTTQLIMKEDNPYQVKTIPVCGDSTSIPIDGVLSDNKIEKVQIVILHPPYWDIIKFSDDPKDLSNAESCDDFLKMLGDVTEQSSKYLESGRYLALIIGDKYAGGEWIPLGFYAMEAVMKKNFKLKSIVVKNFNRTKGKRAQEELWRYRSLTGGFYVFKHEYVYIFQKS